MENIKIENNKEIISNYLFLNELKISVFNGKILKIYIFNRNKVETTIKPGKIKNEPYYVKNLNVFLKNTSIVVETKEYNSNIPPIVTIIGSVSNWELLQ